MGAFMESRDAMLGYKSIKNPKQNILRTIISTQVSAFFATLQIISVQVTLSDRSKILIASSQPVLSKGIQSIIHEMDDVKVVGIATDAGDLKQKARMLEPDLIILDRNLAGFFSEPGMEQDNAFLADYKVTLFSDFDKESIYKLHKLNITGFITTYSNQQEIQEAVKSNLRGIKFFSPKVVEVLIELSFRKAQPEKQIQLHESLSEREMEIFMLVTQGKSTKEIADTLFLSTHTVYTHRKNILKKLSCKSAAELINYAYSQGLMEKE